MRAAGSATPSTAAVPGRCPLHDGVTEVSWRKARSSSISTRASQAAPLWCYVLAEAQHEWLFRATGPGGKGNAEPVRLGAVGRRIVAETLIGLLTADGRSYLRQNPNWQPVIAGQPIRTMGSLLKFASS